MSATREHIKVAVIGGGLAGLTAAHLLSSSPALFEVHVFEKASQLGLDAHSISILSPSAGNNVGEQRIDVPMRSFQDGYYKQLMKLYRKLGIQFRRCDFTYSFSSFYGGKTPSNWITYLLYNGRSGVKGFSLRSPHKKDLEFDTFSLTCLTFCSALMTNFLLLICYLRFILLSMPAFRPSTNLNLQEWSQQLTPTSPLAHWMQLDVSWGFFIDMILVPLFSAVCTAPRELIYEHPVDEILDYVWTTLTSHHYKVSCGIRDVASRLSDNISYIHTSCPVRSIVPDLLVNGRVSISTPNQVYGGFSHVVIATEANEGATLLDSYLGALDETRLRHRNLVEQLATCLRTVRYCKAIVINHRDERVLPPEITSRKDLNLANDFRQVEEVSTADKDLNVLPASYTMTTHVISSEDETQDSRDSRHTAVPAVYQTTNPTISILKEAILSVSSMNRAVLSTAGKRALAQLSVIQASRSRWRITDTGTRTTILGPLQGAGCLGSRNRDTPGIWICGSYAHHGIPLLEGCVGSAKDVVEQGILPSEGLNTRVLGFQL